MIRVTLDSRELDLARKVGRQRNNEAKKRGLEDKYGFDGQGAAIHALGVAGEIAVAGYLNLTDWVPTINTFKGTPDVSEIEVRTRSKDHYDLIVRPDDSDESIFVLVTGMPPDLTIRGWVLGEKAKVASYLKEYGGRPPAYFVPQGALLHPNQLPRRQAQTVLAPEADVCPYPAHRETDWRFPVDSPMTAVGEVGRWVCGVCHPCGYALAAGSDEFAVADYVMGEATNVVRIKLERRE